MFIADQTNSWITTQSATLIAATIAAIASILKLFADRGTEGRSAYRTQLQVITTELGEAIYQIAALSNILVKATGEEEYKNWKAKAVTARDKLKALRPKARYPLWGLDDGIRTVIRLPDWVIHTKSDPIRAKVLVDLGTKLRKALDYSIRKSYAKGRPPSALERLRVNWYSRQCRKHFDAGSPNNSGEL